MEGKAREVFEERKLTERTEAPTCLGEGLKLCLSVIKREKWRVRAIDVKTAYLQGKNIERTIVVKPPREANRETMEAEEGIIWPLGYCKGMV